MPESFAGTSEHRVCADADALQLEIHASQSTHAERIRARRTRHSRSVKWDEECADSAAPDAGLRRREYHCHVSRVARWPPTLSYRLSRSRDRRVGPPSSDWQRPNLPAPRIVQTRRSLSAREATSARFPSAWTCRSVRERLDDQRVLHRQDDGEGGAGAGDGFNGQSVGQVVTTAAAVIVEQR